MCNRSSGPEQSVSNEGNKNNCEAIGYNQQNCFIGVLFVSFRFFDRLFAIKIADGRAFHLSCFRCHQLCCCCCNVKKYTLFCGFLLRCAETHSLLPFSSAEGINTPFWDRLELYNLKIPTIPIPSNDDDFSNLKYG